MGIDTLSIVVSKFKLQYLYCIHTYHKQYLHNKKYLHTPQILKEKGYTLKEMAKDLNTIKVTLSRYENGTREPKSEILNQLSDYLFGKTDEKTPKTKDEIINVKKAIEEIKDELENSNSLMFDGECLSE